MSSSNLNLNKGLHRQPHRPAFGDLSDGVDAQQSDDGVRDCSHPVHHHQLVAGSLQDHPFLFPTGIAQTKNVIFRTLTYKNASNTDAGLQMTMVFKRRLLNAILTVYLPTILVLTIVYATNFFKDFFFELGQKFQGQNSRSTLSGPLSP